MLYGIITLIKQLCCISTHLRYVKKKKKNPNPLHQVSPALALRGMPQSGLLTPPLFEMLNYSVNPVNYRGEETSSDYKIRGVKIRPTETWPVATRRQMAFAWKILACNLLLWFEWQNRSIFSCFMCYTGICMLFMSILCICVLNGVLYRSNF